MTQFVGRHIAPEMLALGFLELLLTFTLAYVFLTPSSGGFALAAANQALICALTVGFIALVIGLYRPQMFQRARGLVANTLLSALLSFPAVWAVSKVSGLNVYWPVAWWDSLRPVKIVLIWCGALIAIRLLFLIATRFNLFLHRVALVGAGDAPSVQAAVQSGRRGFLEVSVVPPERTSTTGLSRGRVRTLVLARGNDHALVPAFVADCQRRGIRIESESEFWERHLRRVDIANLDAAWFAGLEGTNARWLSLAVSRVFDIVVSMALLLTTLPLMAVVALLVRLDSPGPVLYRQERVGLGGRPFTCLKFRSMRMNAEAAGPTWAQQRDPRVTRIGSFIRRTRIDELPQLINILGGAMSFIGPRPERPHFVEQLAAAIPFYHERARVKPGLTGWAQVNYPYGASVEDARAKLSFDLYYVKNRSLLLDLLILLSTIRVVLFQEGSR
jgi:exopolysaccharide biosynthesis polyprenyl glycosylphosphotransferase